MDNELSASPKMDDRLTLVAALDLAIASGRDFHGLPLAQLRAALRQDSSGGVGPRDERRCPECGAKSYHGHAIYCTRIPVRPAAPQESRSEVLEDAARVLVRRAAFSSMHIVSAAFVNAAEEVRSLKIKPRTDEEGK
jgi:hypothetical protein